MSKRKVKSSTGDSWCTPGRIVDKIWAFNGRPPALDPFSNPNSIVGADVEWYGPDAGGTNGFMMPWHMAPGLVFFNPPHTEKFRAMQKAHLEARQGAEIIGLLPADTETRWFHQFAVPARKRCFLMRRLTFGGDRVFPARFPSLLIYWGKRGSLFQTHFSTEGWVI